MDFLGLFGGGGRKEDGGPTSKPSSAIGGGEDEDGFNLWSGAGKLIQGAGKGLERFSDEVGDFFGLNKQNSTPAPQAPRPEAAKVVEGVAPKPAADTAEVAARVAGEPPAPTPTPPTLRAKEPAAAGAAAAAAGVEGAAAGAALPAATAAAALAKEEPPPPATPPAAAGGPPTPAQVSADFVMERYGSGTSTDLSNKPNIGLGSLFPHANEAINKLAYDGSKGFRRIGKVFQGDKKKDDPEYGILDGVSDVVAGSLGVVQAAGEGLLRAPGGVATDAIRSLEDLVHSKSDNAEHHLVSTNTANAVKSASELLLRPLKTLADIVSSDNNIGDVLKTSGEELIESSKNLVRSSAGVVTGVLGIDIEKAEKEAEERKRNEDEERKRNEDKEDAKKEAEKRKRNEAEEKAKKEAEEKAKKEAEEKAKKEAEAAKDQSNVFESLFYNARNVDEYMTGYNRGFEDDQKIFMHSKFSIQADVSVDSVTFFEKVEVESRKSGRFYGTQKRTTENGKKEVVLIGSEALDAQKKMFEEYQKNAKEILELEARVEQYNRGKSDGEKIELGDLCKIDQNKDFNFLIKDGGNNNIVNSPLKERINKIRGIIGSNRLSELEINEKKEIEKEANDFAKILLAAQVKNNCLYTEDKDVYKEAKRINIFRGKKDFKTGKSVIEVKFGSSCVEKDFALIPVGNSDLNLFCKVSHNGDGNAKLEYFKKENNELKLLKYDRSAFYGSNLRYDDKGGSTDVLGKKEIIKAIEGHRIDVSWANEVSNSTKQLNADGNAGVSVGGDSTSAQKKEKIKSFGSQSYVIIKQKEYQVKSRNTPDWWNNLIREPTLPSDLINHHNGFSVKKKDIKLSSTGAFSFHNNDEKTRQKILASEFEIDVKIDSSGTITSKNSDIDSEKNPKLTNALQILNKLKFDDNGNLKAGFSTDSTDGVQSRFFRKPKFLGGEVKQGGSMVVNMNVVNENGVKSRIRVEFGVKNMRPGLITTGDKLVIKSVSKIDKDRESKWVESIKQKSDHTTNAHTR